MSCLKCLIHFNDLLDTQIILISFKHTVALKLLKTILYWCLLICMYVCDKWGNLVVMLYIFLSSVTDSIQTLLFMKELSVLESR